MRGFYAVLSRLNRDKHRMISHPRGLYLAFFREQPSGSTKLFTIDLTGNNERQVPTPLDASDPAWSPLNSY